MKTRWKILIAVGVFMVLSCVLSLVTLRVGSQNRLEAYKKLLIEKGEKLEITEVMPPAVPAESNGVELVEAAFKSFGTGLYETTNLPPAMRMIAPGKALVGWQQAYWFESSRPAQTNGWEDAAAAVESDRMAVELLKQAAIFPVVDFHLDYNKNGSVPLAHLSPSRHAAQSLSAAAVLDLYNNDPAAAVTNICTLLSLIQAERTERIMFSQQIRASMANHAMNATWELLQSTNLTDSQLEPLQARWRQLDFFRGAEGALLMMRAWQEKSIQQMRQSPSEYARLTGGGSSGGSPWSFSSSGDFMEDVKSGWQVGKSYAGLAMWRSSWSYADEERVLQKDQVQLEALRQAQTNPVYGPIVERVTAQLAALKVTNSTGTREWRWLFSESFFYNLNRPYVRWFAYNETTKLMTEAAISLKRFQIKHGRLPGSLAELVPEYLPAIPVDPMDGKPLRYRANPDGTYLLYSIGSDGKDDGGDATPAKPPPSYSKTDWPWLLGRDWVWPQPATAAEIKSYYDEQEAKAAAERATGEPVLDTSAGPVVVPPPPVPAGTN